MVVVPRVNPAVQRLKALGDKAYSERNFEEALECYSEALESCNDVVVLSNRSAANAQLRRFEKARNDAEKALAVEPNWPRLYHRLGYAQFYLGSFQEALAAFARGLELDPTDGPLQEVLARATSSTEEAKLSTSTSISEQTLMEQERLRQEQEQQERLQQEKERLRQEQEWQERLQQEKERLRQERERQERLQQEKERLQQEQERQEQERERQEQERQEQERQRKEQELQQKEEVFEAPSPQPAEASRTAATTEDKAVRSAASSTGSNTAAKRRPLGAFSSMADSVARARSAALGDPEGLLQRAEARSEPVKKPSAEELREKGNLLYREGKYQAAVKLYTASLDTSPEDARTWANRAAASTALLQEFAKAWTPSAMRRNAYYDSASKDLNESLERDPKYVKAWARKGQLLQLVGEFSKALEAYESGLEIDAESSECLAGKHACEQHLRS